MSTIQQNWRKMRQQAGRWLIGRGVRTLATVARFSPAGNFSRHGIRVVRDVCYRNDRHTEARLDIYQPQHLSAPFPVVLYLHGGGFQMLSKDTHWIMGRLFAEKGFLVANVDYRLAPKHPFPAALEDSARAYAWLVDHAAAFGGDSDRLVLAGESAGANLATALTLAACFRRDEPCAKMVWDCDVVPRAVLPTCGYLQVSDPGRFRRSDRRFSFFVHDRLTLVSEDYLGPRAANPDHDSLADPLLVLEGTNPATRSLPPFFAAVGSRDPLLDDTLRLARAMERRGVRCDLRCYEGSHHAFSAFIWSRNAKRFWRDAFAFLDTVVPHAFAYREVC